MNLAFGRGLDQRGAETTLAPGFVRDVVNLDIAPGQYAQKVPLGHARTRIGRTLVHASDVIGGCWSDPRVGFGLFVDGTALVRLAPDGERTTLATVTASSLCAEFVPEQGAVYWSTGAESGRIVAGASIAWGLPEPAAPALSAGVGALSAGTYQVAVAWANLAGEEGGLSPVSVITIEDGQGIVVTLPDLPDGVVAARIYRSRADGDELLAAMSDVASVALTAGTLGRPPVTRFLRRFPPVTRLLHWHGRMWGAVDSTLIYSAIAGGMPALHLYHPVGGCLSMDAPVTMILPTLDGLYIGTTMSAWFLSGDAPEAPMRRVRVDGDGVLGAMMAPAGAFQRDQPDLIADMPAWMSTGGDVLIGRPGGVVQRIGQRLAFAPSGPAAVIHVDDGRGKRLIVSAPGGSSSAAAPLAPVPGLVDNGVTP